MGRFCLFKSAYRIGEEIVGSFDFSESFIMCLKVNMLIGSFRQALAGLSLGLYSPVVFIFTPVTNLLLYGRIVSGQFTGNIKGTSSMLSRNRCYGLRPY